MWVVTSRLRTPYISHFNNKGDGELFSLHNTDLVVDSCHFETCEFNNGQIIKALTSSVTLKQSIFVDIEGRQLGTIVNGENCDTIEITSCVITFHQIDYNNMINIHDTNLLIISLIEIVSRNNDLASDEGCLIIFDCESGQIRITNCQLSDIPINIFTFNGSNAELINNHFNNCIPTTNQGTININNSDNITLSNCDFSFNGNSIYGFFIIANSLLVSQNCEFKKVLSMFNTNDYQFTLIITDSDCNFTNVSLDNINLNHASGKLIIYDSQNIDSSIISISNSNADWNNVNFSNSKIISLDSNLVIGRCNSLNLLFDFQENENQTFFSMVESSLTFEQSQTSQIIVSDVSIKNSRLFGISDIFIESQTFTLFNSNCDNTDLTIKSSSTITNCTFYECNVTYEGHTLEMSDCDISLSETNTFTLNSNNLTLNNATINSTLSVMISLDDGIIQGSLFDNVTIDVGSCLSIDNSCFLNTDAITSNKAVRVNLSETVCLAGSSHEAITLFAGSEIKLMDNNIFECIECIQPDIITSIPETPTEEIITPTEEIITPTEEIITPTEEIITPTEEIITPTEEIITPTEEIITPTEEIITPTEEIITPTEEIITPTEEIITPTEEIITPTEEIITPTEEIITPTEEIITPTEEIITPTEEIITPTEEIITPTEEIITPTEEIITPTEEIITPTEEIITPTEEIAIPTEVIVTPTEVIVTPTEVIVTPTEVIVTPTEEIITPTEEIITPTEEIITPTEVIVTPTEEIITPTEVIVTPTEVIVTPTEEIITPTEEIITPTEEIITPTEVIVTPTEVIVTPTEVIVTPTEEIAIPTEEIITSTEEIAIPTEVIVTPTEVIVTPTEVIVTPTEVIVTPTEVIVTPTEVIVTPTEEIAIPTEEIAIPTEVIVTPTASEEIVTTEEHVPPVSKTRIITEEIVPETNTPLIEIETPIISNDISSIQTESSSHAQLSQSIESSQTKIESTLSNAPTSSKSLPEKIESTLDSSDDIIPTAKETALKTNSDHFETKVSDESLAFSDNSSIGGGDDSDNKQETDKKMGTGAIVGIVIGLILAIAIALVLIIVFLMKKKKETTESAEEHELETTASIMFSGTDEQTDFTATSMFTQENILATYNYQESSDQDDPFARNFEEDMNFND